MSIVEKCSYLSVRIERVQKNQNLSSEASNIRKRLKELQKIMGTIEKVNFEIGLLERNAIPSTFDSFPKSNALKHIEKLITNFENEQTSDSLNKRQDWVKFGECIEDLVAYFDETLLTNWRNYTNLKFSGEQPQRLNIAKTEENNIIFKKYSSDYQKYSAIKRKFPTGQSDIDQMNSLSDSLNKLRSQFNFEVPEEVSRFLEEIASGGGASLNLLTESVIEWLSVNNSIDQYKISRR